MLCHLAEHSVYCSRILPRPIPTHDSVVYDDSISWLEKQGNNDLHDSILSIFSVGTNAERQRLWLNKGARRIVSA